MHAIWTLPDGDARYSVRWGRIKDRFTHMYLASGGEEAAVTLSRLRRREPRRKIGQFSKVSPMSKANNAR